MSNFPKGRKNTPRGQMSSSGAGPAIQMMPPHIRATFMPDPPLKHLPNPGRRRPKQYVDSGETEKEEGVDQSAVEPKKENGASQAASGDSNPRRDMPKVKDGLTGVAQYVVQFERTPPPPRKVGPTPKAMKQARLKKLAEQHKEEQQPKVETYRSEQKESGGEYEGMNCYNTLFVGRLAYEVTERKLLREMEAFGPVKDLRLIREKKSNGGGGGQEDEPKSRGYAFVEYEHEEDMKRAYRSADGMRIEGRPIVVDVERGHTVPNWLPRRLGGGLGGTRLAGKDENFTYPGRFDPSKPRQAPAGMMMGSGGPGGGGPNGPPPLGYSHMDREGPPPGYGDRGGGGGGGGRGRYDDRYDDRRGGPPPGYYDDRRGGRYDDRRGGGGGYYDDRRSGGGGGYYDDRKRRRSRSRSPERDRDRRRGRY